jgi:DNA repair exonuclease SbcCD ATPase subunit
MSAGSPLVLRRLLVRRTPGIEAPFELNDLCAGVNIVYGPNGSGKTSSARAMEAALWPSHVDHRKLGVSARYTLDGVVLGIELDAGHVSVQVDGRDGHAPLLPAPELRSRYRLPLHELLDASEHGRDFAAEIAKQSAGGYDLAGAAAELGFRDRSSALRNQVRALQEARDALRRAQDAQSALHAEAARLTELEAERQSAIEAGEQLPLLDRAIEHAEAVIRHRVSKDRLSEYPEVLAGLRGDEHERARELRSAIATAEAELRDAEAALAESEALAATLLPHGIPGDEVVPALREDATRIAKLEQALSSLKAREEAARRKLQVERSLIGDAVSDAILAEADCHSLGSLLHEARKAEQLHAELRALDESIRIAGSAERSEGPSSTTLVNGMEVLSRWMQEPAPPSSLLQRVRRTTLALWVVALVGAIGWGLLAWRWEPVVAVAAVACLLLPLLFTRSARSVPDGREMRERDYARLNLPQPESWSTDAVMQTFEQLAESLAALRLSDRLDSWQRDCSERRDALNERSRIAATLWADAAEELGLPRESDPRQLALLVERVNAWQAAYSDLEAIVAEARQAGEQLARALGSAADRVIRLGYAVPAFSSDVSGVAAALSTAIERHSNALAARDTARRDMDRARATLASARAELASILERAGLEEDSDHELFALCSQHAAYLKAVELERDARRDVSALRMAIEPVAEADPSLLTQSPEELRSRREALASAAERLVGVVSAISSLETRLEAAKRGNDVERAQAEVSAAEEVLRDHRNADLAAMAGHLLVQHLMRATQDNHRPEVFHRARALFTQVTRGCYRLEFDDADLGDASSFRAFDTHTRRSRSLDELSSGTKVQLLLAIRIAFVETQEHGLRLPLFLDETLATSDDERARAIMDGVIALAEEGRQVFYFTAQADEVRRWRDVLRESSVEHAMFDLARIRSLSSGGLDAISVAPPESFVVSSLPSPDGHTHESYGSVLGVPPLRPREPATSAHLWYVVHDVRALHHLLNLGCRHWGQLENVAGGREPAILSDFPGVYTQARTLARALDVLCAQSAIGVGRRVDRQCLLDSEAVTDTMMGAVMELVERYDGNAREIVNALERREVARFQRSSLDRLRDFFMENGYIDDRPAPAMQDIRLAMINALAADSRFSTSAVADVEYLLRIVSRSAGSARTHATGSAGAHATS